MKKFFPTKMKATPTCSQFVNIQHTDKSLTAKNKTNHFCKFFTDIGSNLKNKFCLFGSFTWRKSFSSISRTNKVFNFSYVPISKVQKELSNLKRGKSPGVDMLPSSLLKDGAKEISKPLTHMINRSLSECTIPIEWKHAKITPIHKSGTLDNPDKANHD